MSTLLELKTAIKAFVYNNSNLAESFQGETTEVEIESRIDAGILVAVNNARRWAERNHDFEFTQVSVPATLTSAGVSLDTLTLDGSTVKIKKLTGADLTFEGDTFPVTITTKRDLDIKYLRHGPRERARLYVKNRVVYCDPSPDTDLSIIINGYRWLDNYTALDATTDWLIEHGFDFLMWQSIVELNHIVQIYVPRQEGSLPPPERAAASAWESLVIANSDSMGIYHE